MDVFPNNKTSKFRILLKEPIDTAGDEDWEVALVNINYPYSWANIGPAARVFMKYYIDKDTGPLEVHFPNWQCQSMREVMSFIQRETNQGIDGSDKEKLWIKQDELGRVKITSVSPNFDIGFSDNMLKLLGLAGHDDVAIMTIEAFDRRQFYRSILDPIWKKDQPFDFQNRLLTKQVKHCVKWQEFGALISPYIQLDNLAEYSDTVLSAKLKPDPKEMSLPMGEDVTPVQKDLTFLMYALKKLLEEKMVRRSIKSVTPGILNPVDRMYIYVNIIEPVDMNDTARKLLKIVNTRGKPYETTQEEFTNPAYLPLKKGRWTSIEVSILDNSGEPVSFQFGTSVLTLHFRKAQSKRYF
jgi:hypothetical protein